MAFDEDGFPVEQGEGGGVRPRGSPGSPKYLFHQYNRSTFRADNFTADDFAIPDVCKNTKETCTVWPTSLCEVPSGADPVRI